MLHGRFAFFNPPDVGHPGAEVEISGELVQLVGGADGIYVDPAIVQIPNPASQAQIRRVALYEPPEADSLNPAMDEPLACGGVLVGESHICGFTLL